MRTHAVSYTHLEVDKRQDLRHVFVLEDIGKDDNGDKIKERRNGSGARVYGVNLDAKLAHGKDCLLYTSRCV